ncbi:MAG: hypothetical protein EOP85_07030 [Verrucomicrobiaceae bacterium]|nr:MAG: hypothetical protein EOP85_07030 [Verrucomicrobiaceae bacterium]
MYLALHIPDFPVTAALRGNLSAAGRPCVVLAARGPGEPQEKLPVLAINERAREAGIRRGWPLNRSLVRCPDLTVLSRNYEAEAGLCKELVHIGERLGSDLEVTSPDVVTLDLSSRRNPVGDALNALELEDAFIWHAQASTPDLAHVAAIHPSTTGEVLGPSDLQHLPLEILRSLVMETDLMARLELWGLKTLGEFMKLPRQALTERLGPEAGRCHDLLHGRHCRLLRLRRPPESLAQSFDCDDSITTLDPLVFVVKRMLHTLAGRLGSRHLAARTLDLQLQMEAGGTIARRITLPEPQTQVEGMLSPLQTFLESLRLEGAVSVLHLDAETTFATAAQREWFGRQLPQPERWAETLAKLEALVGTGRVGIPVPADTFCADSFTVRPAIGPPAAVHERRARMECPVPLQRFRPPRPVSVAYETRERHVWPLAVLNGPLPGEITDWRGPFSSSGEWWQPDEAWQRLEWDIQLASRHMVRLTFQLPDQWQLDGVYR